MPKTNQPWPERGDRPDRLAITNWIESEARERLDQADFLRSRMLMSENITKNKCAISVAP